MPETDAFQDTPGTSEVGPQIDAGSYPQNRIVTWIQGEINTSRTHVEKWRKEAKQAYRFRDGKQLSDEDLKSLIDQQRPHNAFNTAQKFIRFVAGVEAYSPEALIFEPIDESDEVQQSVGEFVTRTYDWAITKSYGNFNRARSFEDLVVTGMGWGDYYIDRGRDPRGLPGSCRIPYDEMWWPLCSNQNLMGTRWRARESLIDREEALARWPDKELLIRAATVSGGEIQNRPEAESTIQYIIPYIQTKPIEDSSQGDPTKGKLRIMEFQWYDDKMGYYFFDPLEDDDIWLPDDQFRTYGNRLSRILGKSITDYVRQSRKVHQKVFLLNQKHQLGDVMQLPGNRFTFNCMTSHWDEEEKVFYGYMRILIDPSRYANKFFNQVLEIMGHQPKGGILYEEGAIKPKQVDLFEANYAKPGTSQEVAPGAISGGKIKDKPVPILPQASMAVMEFCIKTMENVSGFSPESAWGQSGANVPGITNKQRQRASLLLLSKEFSSLSLYRIEEGEIIFEQLKTLSDDRLIRVGKPFESEVIQLAREPFMLEYSLNLDDTERDPNIRHLYTENVLAIAPTLIRMGKFIPELLDYMILPVKIRQVLKKAIRDQAQAEMQMSQMGIQKGGRGSPVTPQERAAKVQKIQADTQVQLARASRIKGQQTRDQIKIILETLVAGHKAKLDRDSQGAELAAKALELFDRARGIVPLEQQNKEAAKQIEGSAA